MGEERVTLNYQEIREVVDGIDTDDRSETGRSVALLTMKAILEEIIYKLERLEERK